ncbi:MAG: hypothetical protein F4X80_01550 [Chloroflexi bacterium]|nr:hypothetical protein [Chloroflexota bacterium]
MAAFDTHEAFQRLTTSGMDEAPAEALVDIVGDVRRDLVTRGDLNAALELTVAQLTAEMHRALRVQGMWIVGTIVGLATIAALMVTTALMVLGVG